MFEDTHYRWKDDPVDGEYELQLDRFESTAEGNRYDQAVLLIVDREIEEFSPDHIGTFHTDTENQ